MVRELAEKAMQTMSTLFQAARQFHAKIKNAKGVIEESDGISEKEVREGLADLRKSCILLTKAVLRAAPMWIFGDPCSGAEAPMDRAYTSFVAWYKALGTPLLFPEAIQSIMKICPDENIRTGGMLGTDPSDIGVKLVCEVLENICGALRRVPAYSMPAAMDILQCIRELCEGGFIGLFSAECFVSEVLGNSAHIAKLDRVQSVDIPAALLEAYTKSPKLPPSKRREMIVWKSSCVDTFQSFLRLRNVSASSGKAESMSDMRSARLLNDFDMNVVRHVTADAEIAYRAMGTAAGPLGLGAVAPAAEHEVALRTFGTMDADHYTGLLQAYLTLLIGYIDYDMQACGAPLGNNEKMTNPDAVRLITLEYFANLNAKVLASLSRNVIFEDDLTLLLCEIDYISKIAMAVWSSAETSGVGRLNPNVTSASTGRGTEQIDKNLLVAVRGLTRPMKAIESRVAAANAGSGVVTSSSQRPDTAAGGPKDMQAYQTGARMSDGTVYDACRETLFGVLTDVCRQRGTDMKNVDFLHTFIPPYADSTAWESFAKMGDDYKNISGEDTTWITVLLKVFSDALEFKHESS
jgi:hypothetical protein